MFQVELTDKQLAIVAEALEFHARFLWGQVDHLPGSLEAAPRMKEIYGDQDWHALLPFRSLVWPELHCRGHSHGVRWVEGEPDRQAAQISWEVSRSLTAERNHHLGIASARALLRPLQLSPEPLPTVTWVGPAPAAAEEPPGNAAF